MTVSISDCGRGVRHFGQAPPASCGTITAAHVGQEKRFGTVLTRDYMTSAEVAARTLEARQSDWSSRAKRG